VPANYRKDDAMISLPEEPGQAKQTLPPSTAPRVVYPATHRVPEVQEKMKEAIPWIDFVVQVAQSSTSISQARWRLHHTDRSAFAPAAKKADD
jgi:hypothetical protein